MGTLSPLSLRTMYRTVTNLCIERSPSYPSDFPVTQKHSQSTTREPSVRRRRPTLQRDAPPETIWKTKSSHLSRIHTDSQQVPDEEDRYFSEMDAAAKEYEQVIGAGIEKVVRRLIKRYSGPDPLPHSLFPPF